MSRVVYLTTWGKPLLEVIHERSPGVDVKAFEAAYPSVKEKYVAAGKLDAIPSENYKALDRLIEANKLILVLTSRTHTEVHHLLEPDHLLSSRVKSFYYRDNMQFHKPDPRAFSNMLNDTGFEPNECVYVGDLLSDAQTANAAGLHFIASLESGIRQKKDFEGISVDRFIYKFPDIVEAVIELDSSIITRQSKSKVE